MQFLIALRVSAATTLQSSGVVKRSDAVLVRAVIDGDTIDVAGFGRVRLLGIDAPEVGRGFDTAAPFGKEARERLTSLVLHRWVRLEQEGPMRDVYDQSLARSSFTLVMLAIAGAMALVLGIIGIYGVISYAVAQRRLEQESPMRDVYDRHLAYVMREDGVFVNAALVRDGLARVTARVPLARLDELKRAEAEAQSLRRGMWGDTPQIPTTGYTRRPGRAGPPGAAGGKRVAKATGPKKSKKAAAKRRRSKKS